MEVRDGGEQSLGVKVTSTPSGRAHQTNAGAKAATGNLLFLHADTLKT